MNMQTMKWLLKREMWEHQGAMLYAPLVVGAVTLVLMMVGALLIGHPDSILTAGGVNFSQALSHMTPTQQDTLVASLAKNYLGLAFPVFVPLGFVVLFYALSALGDERKDRSVLFWKSLPVGDASTVASKALTALVVAPALTLAVATGVGLVGLITLLCALVMKGASMGWLGQVLVHPSTYLSIVQMWGVLPIYALWALPAVGWYLLMGVVAPRKTFLWAIVAPVLVGVAVTWMGMVLNMETGFVWDIVARLTYSVMPGAWLHTSGMEEIATQGLVQGWFTHAWGLTLSWQLWAGALVGLGLLGLASHMRRWKDEA